MLRFWGYFHQYVNVVRTDFCFYDPYPFPFAQSPWDFSYGFSFLLVEYFSPIPWREHNMIFALSFRVR